MASVLRSSTPPPPRVRTPQTPRWGDDFVPYSPRKSARLSQLSGSVTPQHRSYRESINSSSSIDNSPDMSSMPSSPQTAKKRASRQSLPEMGGRRVSGALTRDSTVHAASALGLPPPPPPKMGTVTKPAASMARKNGPLPTPDKTPKKRPEEITPAVKSVARNLFAIRPADDDAMPTPRRGRKKYTGFTLDSFEAEESSTPIQIYTDSKERVPELDRSPENPFYVEGAASTVEPTKRSSKRRKVSVADEEEQEIEDLAKREDGLIYVFRGKKSFRKFSDPEPASETDEPESSTAPKRQTRSSFKPRLLFPGPERALAKDMKAHTTEDEEADTDIEEQEEVFTPVVEEHDMMDTPKAPKFAAMFTPPTTVRTTRSKKIDLSEGADGDDDEMDDDDDAPTSPMLRAATRMAKSNPFEEWSRAPAIKDSKKRAGEAASSSVTKKARF